VVTGVRCRHRIRPRELDVGLGVVASKLVEQCLIHPTGPPIFETHPSFLADAERNSLFGDSTVASDCVTELVDDEILGIGGQGLFLALQSVVAADAVARELNTEDIGDTIPWPLRRFILDLDD